MTKEEGRTQKSTWGESTFEKSRAFSEPGNCGVQREELWLGDKTDQCSKLGFSDCQFWVLEQAPLALALHFPNEETIAKFTECLPQIRTVLFIQFSQQPHVTYRTTVLIEEMRTLASGCEVCVQDVVNICSRSRSWDLPIDGLGLEFTL